MLQAENLLTREGPLAQVWLAANLERKLNKTQFLQSNITQSTQAIVKATTATDESPEALTLRLSGQLLYGVVRIYSRKAKYLLDDVSDALLKLKSAFKSSANTVTLPVNATIVPSMKQIVLQDTITQSDLLYQEPLTFDDEPQTARTFGFFGTHAQNSLEQYSDESIEMPRNKFDDDIDDLQQDDGLDIDLNFDLDQDLPDQDDLARDDFGDSGMDFDLSVEAGRAAEDPNLSQVMDDSTQGIGLALEDFDQPLETIEDVEEEQEQQTQQLQRKKRKRRQQPVGKKIVLDAETELNIRTYSNTDDIVAFEENDQELDFNSKKYLMEQMLNKTYIRDDIAEQFFTIRTSKRQKTRPSSPEIIHEPPELQSDKENESASETQDYFEDFDMGFQLDDHKDVEPPLEEDLGLDEVEEDQEDVSQGFNSGVTESTTKVEQHITELLQNNQETTFTNVIEKDVQTESPLSAAPKSEATRVFFELLVLSTGDKIRVKQQELFGQICIAAV
jgi:cohesin complex subunit SCC1